MALRHPRIETNSAHLGLTRFAHPCWKAAGERVFAFGVLGGLGLFKRCCVYQSKRIGLQSGTEAAYHMVVKRVVQHVTRADVQHVRPTEHPQNPSNTFMASLGTARKWQLQSGPHIIGACQVLWIPHFKLLTKWQRAQIN